MPDIPERCTRSLVEGAGDCCRWFGEVTTREWPEAYGVRTAIRHDFANILVLERPVPAVGPMLEEAERFFGPGVPWRLYVHGEVAEQVRGELERRRFRFQGEDPGMVLTPIRPAPPPPPGLRVELVATDRQREDFFRVVAATFGIPAFILRHLYPSAPSLADDPPIGAFVGYDARGRPVASSLVVVRRRVANIYMVGTVRAARRRGYGAAVTWAAVAAGQAAGADVAALNATPMGRPVYQRMGFRVFDAYPTWTSPTPRLARWRATLGLLGLAFRRPRPTPPRPPPAGA